MFMGGCISFWFFAKFLIDQCVAPRVRPKRGERYKFILRSDDPIRFWAYVVLAFLIGVAFFKVAVYMWLEGPIRR